MNIARVVHTVGSFLALLALPLLVPAAVAWGYGELREAFCFLEAGLAALVIGGILRALTRNADRTVYRREGLLIVVGCWLAAGFLGAVPYVLVGVAPTIPDALFESMSGFTTTGSTVLTELDTYGHGIMIWRSLTQWLGGMGIIVLFVAVLPALGVSGRLLYEFEVPGVEKDDLKPRIRETASLLWKIYLTLSAAHFLALLACGMNLFDTFIHTLSTIASGGFSPYADSIRHFHSVPLELVTTLFMFLAGVNFTLFYQAKRRGFGVFWRDLEFRCYLLGVLGVALTCFTVLAFSGAGSADGPGLGQTAVDSLFTTISIGTTTGYATADYDRWPEFLRFLLVVFMFVGGSSGSTAGGFKVFRILVLFRVIQHELRRFVRPKRVRTLLIDGQKVPDELVRNTLVFFVVAIMLTFFLALVVCALGHDMETSLASVMATLYNIGPGLGSVGPAQDFSALHPVAKVILSFAMLLGRLEVFTALAILQPSLYKD